VSCLLADIAKQMEKIFLFILVIIGYGPFAQTRSLPPIIKKLIDVEGPVIVYKITEVNLITPPDLSTTIFNSYNQIIKNKSGLYIGVNGTGRIYQAIVKKNTLIFERMDNTIFTGYNFGYLFFNMDSAIYSFGGAGFWHVNGNLRKFAPLTKEWNAIAQNIEVPQAFDKNVTFRFIDTTNKSLWIFGLDISPFYLKDRTTDSTYKNKLIELSIESGTWKKRGVVKNEKDKSFYQYGVTPWGIFSGDKVIDLKNNKIYAFKGQEKFEQIFSAQQMGGTFDISFCVDSTIFFGNFKTRIDSLTIRRSDLIDTGLPFYTPLKTPSPIKKESVLMIVVVGLSIISIILFTKLYSKENTPATIASIGIPMSNPEPVFEQKKDENNEGTMMFKSSKILDLLEQRERVLLKFIYEQSSEDRLTTIDEINKVIGASLRSSEIQKRLRSDIITSINEKLGIVTNNKKPVIDKQRSEFDKRSFEYYVRKEHMALVKRIV
jgi:hypothetical protein